MRALIADDDPAVLRSLVIALEVEGISVTAVTDGMEALALIGTADPQVLILDWMMPGMDGLQVARTLRSVGDRTPILMLTARTEVADRVAGLDAGADDYLVKPFDLAELLARVRALLRRADRSRPDVLAYEDLRFHQVTRTGSRAGRPLEFTQTEAALLELFLTRPERVLPRRQIEEHVWGDGFRPASNSLSVYISYLRRKIDHQPADPLLHTVRGVGYMLSSQRDPA